MSRRALAGFRRDAYAMLAGALLDPDEARLAHLAFQARRLQRLSNRLSGLAIYRQWSALLRVLSAGPRPPSDALRAEFTDLLAGPAASCIPCESHYLLAERHEVPLLNAALEREYAAVGLAWNPKAADAPDHLAVELEYMAFLCGREAHAWERRRVEDAGLALVRQQRFMRQHVGRWAPTFARELMATGSRVYAVVGEALEAFIHHDRDLIDLLLQSVSPASGVLRQPAATQGVP
ncbi:MAG TPA: molecular chaperone TorD family protein [bacterium]|nr:molecular chaperone TorD family protein [bacterium]